MRNFLFFLLLLFLGCQSPAPVSETAKKAVFVILDGIPADVLERVETPHLDEIAGAKGYTRSYVGGELGTYSETPTISAPGYMDLLTASWANKHNVWGNYNQDPNYNYWNIFRVAEHSDPSLQTAIFSTWLDNRTILVGEGQTNAGDFKIDYAFDGFEKDTTRFPHDEERQYILNIDKLVTDEAARYIREQAPDLSWIYLEYPDDVGHAKGDGETMDSAVRNADAQMGRVWAAIKEREAMGEDWMMVITTDHGRDSISGKSHGGQSVRERTTWIVTNTTALNERFTNGAPPIVDITPSILKHLGITPPESVSDEMDGISFVGTVSLDQFSATLADGKLQANWHPIEPEGEAQILLTTTNSYKTGGKDAYETLGTTAVADGKFETVLTDQQMSAFEESGVLKILIKAPHNRANYWVVQPE